MSRKPGEVETLPRLLGDHETRISRLEHQPRGTRFPPGGQPGMVLGYNENGDAVWVNLFPPGGTTDQVLGIAADGTYAWLGPMWWSWVGTEASYLALPAYDERVLYVIIDGEPFVG